MSKSVIRDSCNVVCPHCGYAYQPEPASYSEDTRVEICDECGLVYGRWDVFSIDHYTASQFELTNEVKDRAKSADANTSD